MKTTKKVSAVVTTEVKPANVKTTNVVTTVQPTEEKKPRGVQITEEDQKHFGYNVGDRVSYVEATKGQRLFGYVTGQYFCKKNGRSATHVEMEENQPVKYKRIAVYTIRLQKEPNKPKAVVVKTEPATVVTNVAEVKPKVKKK